MEMLRESRARDKVDGVDRNACIVDRSQFFNTQVLLASTKLSSKEHRSSSSFNKSFSPEREGGLSLSFSTDALVASMV